MYKRCIRLLSYEHPYSRTPPLALQLELLIFDDLLTYFSTIFMFKIANNKLPLCISCLFQCLHGSTHRNTRDYVLPRVRLEICKKFIIFAGVQTWLQSPCNMKYDYYLRAFKRSCCTLLSNKYVNM